jgi:hypothetical protein
MPTTNRWLATLNRTMRNKQNEKKSLREILKMAKERYNTSSIKQTKRSIKKRKKGKKRRSYKHTHTHTRCIKKAIKKAIKKCRKHKHRS